MALCFFARFRVWPAVHRFFFVLRLGLFAVSWWFQSRVAVVGCSCGGSGNYCRCWLLLLLLPLLQLLCAAVRVVVVVFCDVVSVFFFF